MKQTNLFSSFLLLISMFFFANSLHAQEKEPYAVLSDNNRVLTFYYDSRKLEQQGMNVGPFEERDENQYLLPDWCGPSISTVVFDKSFASCKTLTSTALWFYELSYLHEIIGIENLNTENVTDMSNMFYCCERLTSLDLSSFNTANVTDMSNMFYDCESLTSLDLSSFNTANVTDMSNMFYDCESLTSLDVSSFNTANVTDMSNMFYQCRNLTSLDVSSFNTANVTNMSCMFCDCGSLKITSLDLSNFNTANVTNMEGMFSQNSILTSLDLSNFNTANVTNMSGMFWGCEGLTSLDLSNFNTANVTSMSYMFKSCEGLTSLDVSSFNTVNVTDMAGMFEYCKSLTSLDLSSFNTANVTDMALMFELCTFLTTIYASELWSMENIQSPNNGMFWHSYSLVGGCGTRYLGPEATYARIDGGADAPGYFTYKAPTSIQSVVNESNIPSATYDLSGKRLTAPQKGINIIGDKKVIVK